MAKQTLPKDLETHIIRDDLSWYKQLDRGDYATVHILHHGRESCAGKIPRESTKGKLEIHYKECRILSKLTHKNIVRFIGIGFLPKFQIPMLVMERLTTSLAEFLDNQGKISFHKQVSILLDVASGLEYLHYGVNPPIIHRDLSAGNVLLNGENNAKIADFGCSKILEPDQPMTPEPGTRAYMPPEAAQKFYGLPLDMFSFGTLSLYVATQMAPDRNLSNGRIKYLRLRGNPLVDLICGCLHKDPSKRPTATKAQENLQDILHIL